MHCYQNYRRKNYIHYHRYHSLVFHYCMYFLPRLNRIRNLHHQDCIFLYCMLYHNTHYLTRFPSNPCCIYNHNLRNQTHTLSLNTTFHNKYCQPQNHQFILHDNSLANSRYELQSIRLEFNLIQCYLDQSRNSNQESCIPHRKSHLPAKHLITPCYRSYPLKGNFMPVFMCTRHLESRKIAFSVAFFRLEKVNAILPGIRDSTF